MRMAAMNRSGQGQTLLVIGAGIGGYTAAIRAAREGMDVTLLEAGELGGTCLNVGCIPTKSLLHQAQHYRQARAGGLMAFGVDPSTLHLNYEAVSAQKNQVVNQLVQGVQSLVRRNRITLIRGTAEFLDAHQVRVRETGALLRADRFVIATGSEPIMPALPGIDLPGVVNSDGALALQSLPQRVVILGAGVIGVEFAQIFSAFGRAVTVLEMQDSVLRQEDPDVVAVLVQDLKASGVSIQLNTRVDRIASGPQHLEVIGQGPDGMGSWPADLVLVATGRRPRTAGLGLDALGLQMNQGAIATDEFGRTSIPHIYAVGDVRGGWQLAHKAGAEAECSVAHMLGNPHSMSALVIPRAVYTNPQIAAVGLTEAQAAAQYERVQVGRFPFSASGKALVMGQAQGFIKLIADAQTHQIVGIGMVGPDVTDLLGEATLAVQMELTLPALMQSVHAHPTLSEALMEAAHDAFNRGAIHLPPPST